MPDASTTRRSVAFARFDSSCRGPAHGRGMSSQKRIPAGVPSGGQFGAVPRTESDVRLESSGRSGDRPPIGVDTALDAFPSVVADRVADETAQRDRWDDPTAWDLHIQGIQDATCHATGREAVVGRVRPCA